MPGAAMKRVIAVMLAFVALTGPVFGQMSGRQRPKTPLQVEDEQRKKAAEKADKEYEAMMKKNQGQATPTERVDPWQNMRSADDGKAKQ